MRRGNAVAGRSVTERVAVNAVEVTSINNPRWDWIAPFGRPVVPLVNNTAAGSSGPMSTSGSAAVGS